MKSDEYRLLAAAIVTSCLGVRLLAGVAYLGGPYDGYDGRSDHVAIGFPQVNNANGATNVTTATAWLNGTLVDNGGAAAQVFVFWGTENGGSQTANWQFTNSFGEQAVGSYLTHQVGVAQNTLYHYRFYASNTLGRTAWASSSASFLTASSPSVETNLGVAPVSYETATLHGQLTAGISADTYIFWGAADQGENLTWPNTNTFGTIGHGPFAVRIGGLTPGTEYAYRCYATNQHGFGWSDAVVFTTAVPSVAFLGGAFDGYDAASAIRLAGMPQVDNTLGATNVTTDSAWLNGSLLDTAGESATVTVYWGLADGQTNTVLWDESYPLGTFFEPISLTHQVTGLVSGVTYYFRFRVVNDALVEAWAPSSAEFVTFSAPQVITDAGAAPVGPTHATLYGRLTGGITGDVTLYWSDQETPADWKSENALGVGTVGEFRFRSVATGLSAGETYYYRVYATNTIGDAWSPVISFTTPLAIPSPVFDGGFFDGYDRMTVTDQMRSGAGTLFMMR